MANQDISQQQVADVAGHFVSKFAHGVLLNGDSAVLSLVDLTRMANAFKSSADVIISQAAKDIMFERKRQIDVEGWTEKWDDGYKDHELSYAASSSASWSIPTKMPLLWPWDASSWKPTDRRSNLVKAGALILAEIERLYRAEAAAAAAAKKDGTQ